MLMVKASVPTLAALLVLLSVAPASANGGAVEIFRGSSGAYQVAVGVLPEKPQVGTVHFSITLLDAVTLLPVTDAKVVIVASDARGRPTYQARALNTPASPQYYDANITFESPGAWTLLVEVRSDQLGEASITTPLQIEEQSLPPAFGGALVLLAIMAVLIGGAAYVWHSGRRHRRDAGVQQ